MLYALAFIAGALAVKASPTVDRLATRLRDKLYQLAKKANRELPE